MPRHGRFSRFGDGGREGASQDREGSSLGLRRCRLRRVSLGKTWTERLRLATEKAGKHRAGGGDQQEERSWDGSRKIRDTSYSV
jgi:hypothetical protein